MKRLGKINWTLVCGIVLLAILLSACGGEGSSSYKLQEVKRYGETEQFYVPEKALTAEEVKITLPTGNVWTTHVEGQGCRAFELSKTTGLPVAEVAVSEGAQFPPESLFSVSCKGDGRIYWTRIVIPTPQPVTTTTP